MKAYIFDGGIASTISGGHLFHGKTFPKHSLPVIIISVDFN
jgi:hypothetical protein